MIVAHLEALDNFRQLTGRDRIAEREGFQRRVHDWQKAQGKIIAELMARRNRADA